MSNYLIAQSVAGANLCVVENIENLPEGIVFYKETEFKVWPENVTFHMNAKFPKNVELSDWVKAFHNAILVSKRMKELIEASKPGSTQFLPAQIADHKKKIVANDYFVVNPFKLQNAIDLEKSIYVLGPQEEKHIVDCTTMIFDETQIDKDASLFRLKHYPSKVAFRRDLAMAIKKAGFTGIKFVELEDFE